MACAYHCTLITFLVLVSVLVFVLVVFYECICGLWVPLAGREVGLCSLVSNFFWEISLSQSLEISTSNTDQDKSLRKIGGSNEDSWQNDNWLITSNEVWQHNIMVLIIIVTKDTTPFSALSVSVLILNQEQTQDLIFQLPLPAPDGTMLLDESFAYIVRE